MTYFENNPQLELAYKFLHYTNQNVFLTGKAGTGKTTFLKNLRKSSPKRMVVVAPTGVAAINAGGVTIHSFFQLPFGPQLPQYSQAEGRILSGAGNGNGERINRFSKNKINLIRSLDLLVIDEISMVRADVLDAIDATLRRFKNRYQPFGGIQLLMIGDLQQLAPVVKEDEWEILKNHYQTCFFFSSLALKKSSFVGIELKHIYRQSEQAFIDLLNKVRDNELDFNDLQLLNSRFKPRFSPADNEGYITLTTHNYQARQINDAHLQKLSAKLFRFHCKVEGDFPAFSYPADEVLELKAGAQVMFLKNDLSPEKRYYNGKIGKVVSILDEQISVLCPGETEPIIVEPDFWENTKYRLNESTSEIEEEVAGKFIQYPLKLAWAITIHKSQGLTFEKAIIDAAQSFAHGQVYVALSRCKNLDGLVLSTPLNQQSVINDNTVTGFINHIEQNEPGDAELEKYRRDYELFLLNELIDFKPIARNISYIIKMWNENAGTFMGNLQQKLQSVINDVHNEMIDVAEKFRPQMENLVKQHSNAEENRQLQERLQKASAYFLAKLQEHLVSQLDDASYDTDNRALRKRIAGMIGTLETEIEIKKACLESVAKGFTIKDYLIARALANIEKPAVKARTQAAAVTLSNADFYRKLMEWRANKSVETGMDEARIIRQKVMVAIAEKLPCSAAELKAVKGMGGKKMEHFGQDILSLILNYRREKKMEVPSNFRQELELAGLDTKEISLALFRQGLRPQEISKKRKLAITTIENHLAHWVNAGKLDVFELLDKDKYSKIVKSLNSGEFESLTEIKEKLGDEVSFGEIRLVIANEKRQTV